MTRSGFQWKANDHLVRAGKAGSEMNMLDEKLARRY
jgi:hypothetical protein